MAARVVATLEGLGKLPWRVLQFLLSDHHLDHVSDEMSRDERQKLMKTEERLMTLRAGLYGVLSGLGIVFVVLLAEPYRPQSFSADWWATIFFYSITGGFGIFITIFELFLIYADTLRTARSLALISGIRPAVIDDESAADELVLSLMYAGLRAPNSHEEMHGINPREHLSRVMLLFGMVAHKSKIKITRVIIKTLYRRILVRVTGRTASRAAIESISVPVFAIWNMIAVHRVMREIRIRSLVPLGLEEVEQKLYPAGFEALSSQQKVACLVALKAQVVGVFDFHPNVKLFLQNLIQKLSKEEHIEFQNNTNSLIQIIENLALEDRRIVYLTFCAACGMDGRIKRKHKKTLRQLKPLCPSCKDNSPKDWRKFFLSKTDTPL